MLICLCFVCIVYCTCFRKYDGSDGSKRVRIRYTVSGPKGKAIVYAEVRTVIDPL
jgi:hypothetical protein